MLFALTALCLCTSAFAAPGLANFNQSLPLEKRGYSITDQWKGNNFWNGWNFYSSGDPTHGQVSFLNQNDAMNAGLAYIDGSGRATMRVDSYSNLGYGQNRNSVRLSSKKAYNGGLFILDAAHFPTGCAVWPAFWMFGPNWPANGEIDIFENVNLSPNILYTAHTTSGCTINGGTVSNARVTTSNVIKNDCGPDSVNSGCSFQDKDSGYAAPGANANGGGVIAMLWTSDSIRIWNFPANSIPWDIQQQQPVPSSWGTYYLKAIWGSPSCSPNSYFHSMNMVFDITLCGDWAGAAYTSTGCSGSCANQVMTGSNFKDALWAINSVTVYNGY